MKTGQIFWGIFFVVIGALILLTKYNLLACDWYFVWDLWPFILIFFGLLVVSRKTIAKPVVSLLFGIFVAVLVYGFFHNVFYFADYYDDCDNDRYYASEEIFMETYEESEYAELDVEAGAGNFTIKDRTNHLVKGVARGAFADYDFYSYSRGNTARAQFNLSTHTFKIFDKRIKNYLDIELNENPIWDMDLDIGAAITKLDLTSFKVRDIELTTGATKTFIILGDLYDNTNLNVDMGATSLVIKIPESSGCRLTGKMFLMSKDIPGFVKRGKKYYETPNYDDADNKIEIDIEGGVSSLEINRY